VSPVNTAITVISPAQPMRWWTSVWWSLGHSDLIPNVYAPISNRDFPAKRSSCVQPVTQLHRFFLTIRHLQGDNTPTQNHLRL